MSNVLIGIIGVILFIGLALAGALILGDDFKSASSDAKAAAVQSQMQQFAQAIAMYSLKTGRPMMSMDPQSLLVPRFLKNIPVNPVVPANGAGMIDAAGRTAGEARFITMSIGNSKDVCDAISMTSSGIPAPDVTDVSMMKTAGCVRVRGAFYNAFVADNMDGRPDTWYYAYSRI